MTEHHRAEAVRHLDDRPQPQWLVDDHPEDAREDHVTVKTAVTAWVVTCDDCEAELSPPRAQDYWPDDELDELDWRLEANEWTRCDDGTRHRCRDCNARVTTCRACGWAGSATETAPFDRCPNCKQDTVRDDVVYNAPPDLTAHLEA